MLSVATGSGSGSGSRQTSSLNILSLLSLLDDTSSDSTVLGVAIDRLLLICDRCWPQIATSLPQIAALAEDEHFPFSRRAALLAATVAFHLEDEAESMRCALLAADEFVCAPKSDFTVFVSSRLVDAFLATGAPTGTPLERLVHGLVFQGGVAEGLGVALEARRLDWIEQILPVDLSVLSEFFALSRRSLSLDDALRPRLFALLAARFLQGARGSLRLRDCETGDWWRGGLCALLETRERSTAVPAVAAVFSELLASEEDPEFGWLLALQLALDLVDEDYALDEVALLFPAEPEDVVAHLKDIVSRKFQTRLTVDFFQRANKADVQVLEALKTATAATAGSPEMLHNAVVIANGLMHAGTTNDAFLRANLDWLARANLWAKFTATVSLGAIHHGHHSQGRSVLSTYLPASAGTGGAGTGTGRSAYSEGGALMGLGVVFAGSGDGETRSYLRTQLATSGSSEVQQYGAALGLGLTVLGQGDGPTEEEYETVKTVLYSDNAVAGEAAGLSIGMLHAGSGNLEVVEELLRYGKETSHEKIARGCMLGIGLVLMNHGGAENVESVMRRMVEDETDPVVRWGGVISVGMAHNRRASELAIKTLLNKTVYDSNDDVKRAAVTSLAFVLNKNPTHLAQILKLLRDSHNPHIRHAVAVALGLCPKMAGVEEWLETLSKDSVDFVRQGAYTALGLRMMQQQVSTDMAEKMLKIATQPKSEESIVRMGAIVGLGLMNLSGKNATLEISSVKKLTGMCLFAQSWFSHTFQLLAVLAATPTCCIGLTGNLRVPRNFAAKAKTALALPFAYPPPLKVEEKKPQEAAKVAAVLSVTRQRSKRLALTQPQPVASASPKMEVVVPSGEEKKRKLPENVIYFNPFRVTRGQEKIVEFFGADELQPARGKNTADRTQVRYVPLIPGKRSGWIILKDLRPNEPEDLFDSPASPATAVAPPTVAAPTEQPAPPEEFEWSEQ